MIPVIKLSVVVAVQHAQDNLPDMLGVLQPTRHPDVEFLFCHTPSDPDVPELIEGENARALCGRSGALIPHLWRDGIMAARGERIATTTAHFIPGDDWVHQLREISLADAAGVGGVIENEPTSDKKGWAVFLLRYASYAPPRFASEVREVAADNALYRRADLLRHCDLLIRGFWEPSFHARFRAEGQRLRLDPSLRVVHRNCYSARQFLAQRWAHGREFGLTRATALPISKRLLLVGRSAGIPLVLLARIVIATRGKNTRQHLLKASFWLMLFVLGWSAGEAQGYIGSLMVRRRQGPDKWSQLVS